MSARFSITIIPILIIKIDWIKPSSMDEIKLILETPRNWKIDQCIQLHNFKCFIRHTPHNIPDGHWCFTAGRLIHANLHDGNKQNSAMQPFFFLRPVFPGAHVCIARPKEKKILLGSRAASPRALLPKNAWLAGGAAAQLQLLVARLDPDFSRPDFFSTRRPYRGPLYSPRCTLLPPGICSSDSLAHIIYICAHNACKKARLKWV